MDVLIVGKYPPTQGGTSLRAFSAACALTQNHSVRVVTWLDSAWTQCSQSPPGPDTVHVTSESPSMLGARIPDAEPILSILLGRIHGSVAERRPDAIVGFYLEPFGMAAAIAGSHHSIPYYLVPAGSDLVRLTRSDPLRTAFGTALSGARAVLGTDRASEYVRHLVGSTELHHYLRLQKQQVAPWHRYPARSPKADHDALFQHVDRCLAELGPSERSLIEAHVDRDATRSCSCSFSVVVAGKCGPHRKLGEVITACGYVAERLNTTIHLTLLTGGPESYIRDLADILGAPSRSVHVVVSPFVEPQAVSAVLKQHDAVLTLEVDHDVDLHAGTGVREALLSGTPTIISGGLHNSTAYRAGLIESRSCYIVDEGNLLISLSDCLCRCFTSSSTDRSELGASGRAIAVSYESMLPATDPIADALNVAFAEL